MTIKAATLPSTAAGMPAGAPLPHLSKASQKRYSALLDANGTHLVIALELLGGHEVLPQTPRNLLDVHRWVSHGIPSASITHLAQAIEPLNSV